MVQPLPIYRELGRTYAADTCAPVARAVSQGQLVMHALARGHYPGRKLPVGALAGVKSVGFWDADREQDWGLEWHRNEGLELTYLESGQLLFSVDGQEVALKPGDLTITRPWQLHCLGRPHIATCRLHWLILDLEVRRPHQAWKWPQWLVLSKADLKQLTDMLRHNEQPVWRASDDLRRAFERTGRAVETDKSGENFSRITLQLNEVFLSVLEMCRRSQVPLDASLSSSLRTVDLFLRDLAGNLPQLAQEWTLPRMARLCGLGTTHFIHHCRQLTNLTPLQYLNTCRLEAARRMLCDQPEKTVTEVALACGFSSSQYFATVFRAHFGRTPRELRESAPGDQAASSQVGRGG
jgi:AraC family L-rhamnose operon regulatory protein RhaS